MTPHDQKILDYKNSENIGKINSKMGELQLFRISNGSIIAIGAGSDEYEIFVQIMFEKMFNGMLMAKSAIVDPKYQRMGIASEIILLMSQQAPILSDTYLTDDGERLWQSMIHSGRFKVHIIYLDTMVEKFAPSDIGIAKTQTGILVRDPKDDNGSQIAWSPTEYFGQRFFWMIEPRDSFDVIHEGKVSHYGVIPSRHRPNSLLTPFRHFFEDYE